MDRVSETLGQWFFHIVHDALSNLSDMLSKANIPTILVACKCDALLASRQLNPSDVESLGESYGVEAMQTTESGSGESQKLCVTKIVLMVALRKG